MTEHDIHRQAIVPYSPEKMYLLVNDLPSYPDFVPNCVDGEVLSEIKDEMVGKLTFSSFGLHYAFTTRNTLAYGRSIQLQFVEGPFQHLQGAWEFEPLGDGSRCRVSLHLQFGFRNSWYDTIFQSLFHQVSGNMVDLFVQRAKSVYGD